MKRIISMFLVLMLLISLCSLAARGGDEATKGVTSSKSQSKESSSTASKNTSSETLSGDTSSNVSSANSSSNVSSANSSKNPSSANTSSTSNGVIDNSADVKLDAAISKYVMPDEVYNSGTVYIYSFSNDSTAGNYFIGVNNDNFKTLFKQKYGGKLDIAYTPWEGWETKYITDFAAADAPDVIPVTNKLWPKAANRGLVYTVDQLKNKGVKGLDHPVLESDNKVVLNNFKYKNTSYAIGLDKAVCYWAIVNEDLYKSYGVKSPSKYYAEGKWNIAALKTSSEGLIKASNYEVSGFYCWDKSAFLRANGQQIISVNPSTGALSNNIKSAGVVSALTDLRSLYNKKYATTTSDKFAKGQVGIVSVTEDNIRTAIDGLKFNWSIIPYPLGENNKTGQIPGSVSAFMVSSASKNPQGAVNLVIAYKLAVRDGTIPKSDKDLSVVLKSKPDTINMIRTKTDNAINDNINGIASLWNSQWDFWNAVTSARHTIDELVESYARLFDAAIEQENDANMSYGF